MPKLWCNSASSEGRALLSAEVLQVRQLPDKRKINNIMVFFLREILKSKINNAIITKSSLDYEGSITIPENVMEKVGLIEFEKVLVVDDTNGERLETYVIKGKNDREFVMNGAAAHKIKVGDKVRIMAFEFTNKEIKPKRIVLEKNEFKKQV